MMSPEGCAASASIVLIVALLAGCTAEAPQPSPYSATTNAPEPSPTQTHREMPYDACPPTDVLDLGPEELQREAKQCHAAMTSGRIALVGYDGLKPAVLTRLATDTKHLLAAATHGEVRVKIVPMLASPQESTLLDAVSPTCINVDDIYSWGSYDANNNDPSLDTYDYVIGASTKPSCVMSGDFKHAKGVSSPEAGGRFVELMSADKSLPKTNPVKKLKGGITETTIQQFDATVVGHELLHSLGIGHANFDVSTDTNDPIRKMSDTYSKLKKLDLLAYIKHGQFEEYGGVDNIMGDAEPDITQNYNADYLLNPAQLGWLKQSDVILGFSKDPFVGLNSKPVVATADHIYTFDLPQPLQAKDFAKGNFSAKTDFGAAGEYTELALTPTDPSEKYPSMFDISLLSDNHDTLTITSIYDTGHSTWDLGLGKKHLKITFGERSTKLSVR